MIDWEWIALGYVSYLAVVALAHARFMRARRPVLLLAAAAWASVGLAAHTDRSTASPGVVFEVLFPGLVLLLGYWLSGLFFVRPNVGLERSLLSLDETLLRRTGLLERFRSSPDVFKESLELSYLLVYIVVPAGAALLALAGHGDEVGRFWARVLLAEFACYGTLPWIQTRPPRTLEGVVCPSRHPSLMRRLNLGLLRRGSIRVNTLPSGHAAGAVATALAVGSVMPAAGVAFLLLATSIVMATVLGRYHYALDSALGVAVAVLAWSLL